MKLASVLPGLFLIVAQAGAATFPEPVQGDAVLKDFQFASGESIPALRIHYRTLGQPQRNAQGVVTNAVLITHGTAVPAAGVWR